MCKCLEVKKNIVQEPWLEYKAFMTGNESSVLGRGQLTKSSAKNLDLSSNEVTSKIVRRHKHDNFCILEKLLRKFHGEWTYAGRPI